MTLTLRINPIACTGHGVCAEVAPELIEPDEWGYPILNAGPVPVWLEREARKAVAACPVLALKLQPAKLERPRYPCHLPRSSCRHRQYLWHLHPLECRTERAAGRCPRPFPSTPVEGWILVGG
jgi:ferredoxin